MNSARRWDDALSASGDGRIGHARFDNLPMRLAILEHDPAPRERTRQVQRESAIAEALDEADEKRWLKRLKSSLKERAEEPV